MALRKGSFEGYERIKTIGKGAFGTAVLYRRIADNKDVVIKEIFLSDMTDTEKELAFNEANVLASLNHPNIIRYMGSFEKEGTLLIEMEYADNGNLAQLINQRRQRKKTFREKDILEILIQITAAISYMHSHKVLHRDLKAANIFLKKSGTIKIGDFGISKIMNTRAQAQTVVGTPYYLSPEMCEGKDYDEKSDIWAVGCILYELACFHKPFEAPNLPALVQRISTCEYDEIPDIYSKNLSELVRNILQKDYVNRPSAQYIHDVIIPSFLEYANIRSENRRLSLNSLSNKSNVTKRSVVYHLNGFGDKLDLSPIELPSKSIMCFSASKTHFIVVTLDNLVYTWGKDSFGQLAHGGINIWRKHPICVEYLKGKNIVMGEAGDDFSVFLNKNGLIFTCGDGRQGCLGHCNWNSLLRPTIIDCLITTNISKITCGSKHILALTVDGKVYSWGSSSNGQLGLGHAKFSCTPTLIKLPNEYLITKIFAESNSSGLLDSNGRVLVCGDNAYNKLGVQNETKVLNFQILRILKDIIINVSMGPTHMILVTQSGKVIGLGKNSEGQLGIGNCTTYTYPQTIRVLHNITMISCGPTYTAVATDENVVYFWGTYYKESRSESTSGLNKKLSGCNSGIYHKQTPLRKVTEGGSSMIYNQDLDTRSPELIKKPKSLLALYASTEKLKAGQKIWLEKIHALSNSLMIVVNTTAPPPLRKAQSVDSSYSSHRHSSISNSIPDWMDTNLDYSAMTTLPNTAQFQ